MKMYTFATNTGSFKTLRSDGLQLRKLLARVFLSSRSN